MTRRFQSITHMLLVALVAGLLCAATQASAQTGVRVQIPFAFTANNQQLPAGFYRVDILSENLLAIRDANTGSMRAYLLVRSNYDETTNHSSLLFHMNSGRYILTDLRVAGLGRDSRLLVQPKPEKLLTKNSPPAGSTIELAAK